MNERIRSALRAEAAAHQPDREAMLDRITTAAMRDSGQPATHRRGPRARTAAVVAAVAVLFGGGGVGTWALTGSPGRETAAPAPTTPSPTVTPSPVDTAPVSVAPSPSATRTTTTTTAPPPPPKSPSASPSAAADPLRATGTVDPDGANIVTVTTTRKLTALEVVVRVARTDGLASRGGTKSTPGASVSTTVTEEDGVLLYRFVMSAADTLEPGTYTFTAKYTRPRAGHDPDGDSYQVLSNLPKASGGF